jgi:hypothetical protein
MTKRQARPSNLLRLLRLQTSPKPVLQRRFPRPNVILGLLAGLTIFIGSLAIGIILFLLLTDALKETPSVDHENAVTISVVRPKSD